jgi:hypothetical protein
MSAKAVLPVYSMLIQNSCLQEACHHEHMPLASDGKRLCSHDQIICPVQSQ